MGAQLRVGGFNWIFTFFWKGSHLPSADAGLATPLHFLYRRWFTVINWWGFFFSSWMSLVKGCTLKTASFFSLSLPTPHFPHYYRNKKCAVLAKSRRAEIYILTINLARYSTGFCKSRYGVNTNPVQENNKRVDRGRKTDRGSSDEMHIGQGRRKGKGRLNCCVVVF